MIEVEEARLLISENCPQPETEIIPTERAFGFAVALPPVSQIDTPPFDQSAMDGYCFAFGPPSDQPLIVTGEIQAGGFCRDELKPGTCMRIFTGACIPSGADTVVMQENTRREGELVFITDNKLTRGGNVRKKGSQTIAGQFLLTEGCLLTPAAVSFLAGTGVTEVTVYSKPSVSLIVTGKELVKPGFELADGKIYESNSYGLTAALNQIGIVPAYTGFADDTAIDIEKEFLIAKKSDLVIITGGISVGDYDLVKGVLESCGVNTIFHKVKQKPGKPFYFGKLKKKLIFALPGNPAAVLSCFYNFVVPAIGKLTGRQYFRSFTLKIKSDYQKKNDLTLFLKGKTAGDEVEILTHQESYLLNSFSEADCMVELSGGKRLFSAGEQVRVRMIV